MTLKDELFERVVELDEQKAYELVKQLLEENNDPKEFSLINHYITHF